VAKLMARPSASTRTNMLLSPVAVWVGHGRHDHAGRPAAGALQTPDDKQLSL
jgi:hypothetical protein